MNPETVAMLARIKLTGQFPEWILQEAKGLSRVGRPIEGLTDEMAVSITRALGFNFHPRPDGGCDDTDPTTGEKVGGWGYNHSPTAMLVYAAFKLNHF